ncbi:MAG TPA: hypothetical protein VF070_46530 [Streptosporangiaceae bacterium]
MTWLVRVVRGCRPDRNPLRRGTDRAEVAVCAALTAAFLSAAPFAAHTAANWSHASSLRELQTQRTTFHQVRATLLDAPLSVPAYGAKPVPEAYCRWTAPDGHARTGLVTVPADAGKGSTVLLWTDQSGQIVVPLQGAQVHLREELAAAVAVAVLALVALALALGAHQALNRRRMAAWDADWLATGPRWSSRR